MFKNTGYDGYDDSILHTTGVRTVEGSRMVYCATYLVYLAKNRIVFIPPQYSKLWLA